MTNRFPLIVDANKIKELVSGDNLDLTGNDIAGAGTVALKNLTVNGSQGTNNQVLTSNGSNGVSWADAAAGGAWNVISSTTVSSNVSSVDMTLAGYDNYAITFYAIASAATNGTGYNSFDFSIDGGSNYLSSGIYQRETRFPSWSTSVSGTGRQNVAYVEIGDLDTGAGANTGTILIFDNTAGNSKKLGTYSTNIEMGSLGMMTEIGGFRVDTSSVINKIRYKPGGNPNNNDSHLISAGRFIVYGISTS